MPRSPEREIIPSEHKAPPTQGHGLVESITISTTARMDWLRFLALAVFPLCLMGADTAGPDVLASITALRNEPVASVPAPRTALVLGYWAAGDGGGGTFRYDSTSQAPDDGGTVVSPYDGNGRWLRVGVQAWNVRMFGAKGDGVSDDTAAISAAIDAVPSGSTIDFPAGTYAITNISKNKSVSLRGQGSSVSKVRRLEENISAQSDMIFFTGTESEPLDHVGIFALGFDQAWPGIGGSVFACVAIYRTNRVLVQDSSFTRGQYHGLKINGSRNILIERCIFSRCYYDGIGIGGPVNVGGRRTSHVTIKNNTFTDVFGGPIVQVGVDDVTVKENKLFHSSIQFGQDCTNVHIAYNTVEGINTYGYTASKSAGIFVEGDNSVVIEHNLVRDRTTGTAFGIQIAGSVLNGAQLPVSEVVISENLITNVANNAIQVQAASMNGTWGQEIVVRGNRIINCGNGVTLLGSRQVTIDRNSITGSRFSAVVVGAVDQVLISANRLLNPSSFHANSYYGLDIGARSSAVKVLANEIADTRDPKQMRYGVFDQVAYAGGNAIIQIGGNCISGACTGTLWFPPLAVPTL